MKRYADKHMLEAVEYKVVSDQPQAVVVPTRRDLEREEGEGAPLVD